MEASSVAPEPADTSEGTARAASGASPRAPAGVLPPPPLPRGRLLLRTLGMAEIHLGGAGVITPLAERMFSLLALTAMAPDHVIARDDVLALVWSDADEPSARHSLRQHLYKLRNWGVPIRSTGATVLLAPEGLAPSFALERTAALFDRDVLRGGEPFGHLFAGWVPTHAPMRRWVEDQRDRFQMDVRRILVPELRRLRDRADWVECERWARTVLEFDPYNEDGMLVLAEAIAMQGGRHSARAMLDGYVRETGLAGTELAQVVEAAQRRISRATRVRHEAAATPTLVGRDDELRRLDALTLAALQGQTQVVHLTGPAGIGKTELAYEATRRAVILGFTRCIIRVTRPMGQIPLGMLSRLVRDLLRLPGALGCRPEHLQLLRSISQDPIDVSPLITTGETPPSIEEALLDLFLVLAEEQPLFVLLDDIDLADASSIACVFRAIGLSLRDRIVITSTSQNARSAVGQGESPAIIALHALSLPASISLASSVRSPTGRLLRPADAERVAIAGNGIPIDIIARARSELVAGLTPTEELRSRDGLHIQVQALTSGARLLLQTVAMLGGRARTDIIDHSLKLNLAERIQAFRELLGAGLIEEAGEREVACHSLVAETSVALLTRTERSLIQRSLLSHLLEVPREVIAPSLDITALELCSDLDDPTLSPLIVLRLAPRMIEKGLSHAVLPHLEKAYASSLSRELKSQLLELLVVAAERRADWHRVLGAAAELRELEPSRPAAITSIRITEIEAAIQSNINGESFALAAEAATIANEPQHDIADRANAARVAISAASDLFHPSVATRALHGLRRVSTDTSGENLSILESEMQYHTIFGDMDKARDIALRAHPLLHRGEASAREARFLLNSAYVRRIAGELTIAETMFSMLRDDASIRSSQARRSFATWQLSLIALDRDDLDAAQYWAVTLDEMLCRQPRESWYSLHRERLAFLVGESTVDANLVAPIAASTSATLTRSSAYALAILLMDRTGVPDEPWLTLGVHAARRCAKFVGQDLLLSAVSARLWYGGRRTQARAMLKRYVESERRERFAPLAMGRLLPKELHTIVLPS